MLLGVAPLPPCVKICNTVVVHSFSSWLVWGKIKCTVHVALIKTAHKRHSKEQALRAYCPNIYTVPDGVKVAIKL